MPVKSEGKFGGFQTYWDLGTSNRETLERGLKSLDLEKFLPEPKTPAACLKHGLSESFPAEKDKKIVIRPLAGDGQVGFGVGWLPPKANDSDDYTPICVATIEGTSAHGISISWQDRDWKGSGEVLSNVQDAYREAMCTFSASVVGGMLVDIAESFDCIAMRRKGALYWLHHSFLDRWDEIAKAVESAKTEDTEIQDVHILELMPTERTLKEIADALDCEIGREVSRIEDETANGSHDLRSCERHIKQCNTLLGKIERFETCFEQPLTKLRQYLDVTTQHSAIAALRSSGAALVSSAA